MDNEDMLHADALPATKGDLKAFATKADLQGELARFVTKDDLSRELARFATKDDLIALSARIDARFATKEDILLFRAELLREIAVSSFRLENKLDARFDKIAADTERFRSDMAAHVDKCLSTTLGVKNGEIILGHRVDELEKRVTLLESKPERPS